MKTYNLIFLILLVRFITNSEIIISQPLKELARTKFGNGLATYIQKEIQNGVEF